MSASEYAKLLRQGEVSSVDIVESHLDELSRINPTINAVVALDDRKVLRDAQAADCRRRSTARLPLLGVPITVKDSIETFDYPATCGATALRSHQPSNDATVVQRLREAGAIVLGKTNVPAFTSDYQTNNRLFGKTSNPWHLGRTPGVSTGGGAAAVAAGLSPLDVGSDLGGSLRLPAHYCGVYALKPTVGLIPMTGHIPPWPGKPRGLRHFGTIGFTARSIEDLSLALSVCIGPDAYYSDLPPVHLAPWNEHLDLTNRKVAWSDSLPGVQCEDEIRQGLQQYVDTLASAGLSADQRCPSGMQVEDACCIYGTILGAEIEPAKNRVSEMPAAAMLDPFCKGYVAGRSGNHRLYLRALRDRSDVARSIQAFLAEYEAWLLPVTPTTAITHSIDRPQLSVNGSLLPYASQGWFCLPPSLSHHPVLVIPLGLCKDGLPYGVQVIGRLWRDGELLNLGAALDRYVTASPAHMIPSAVSAHLTS
jgi:amidase